MTKEIQVLVVEDHMAGDLFVSDMLRAQGVCVHVAESCEKAMNKMLEYMDLVVVDSRVEGCTGKALGMIKSRVATTSVIAACPACELESVRLGGRVRADEYIALDTTRDEFQAAVMSVYSRSSRAVVVETSAPRRRFGSAA
ncbi:response regulator [Desulfovibrio ferrophilus]|uniref:Twitching motility two-component system response regulator PilH n=1 Tax=Desulfovibrio ferrophilus TaxID=241368 RepID=A0A2Z6AVZ0_9BACT|nr:response regulator [Desulfovibrio ferrophilus]BBD07404.1 twitching motility two-component system response regulator PilH [Desulfovibrio ferrophilus]